MSIDGRHIAAGSATGSHGGAEGAERAPVLTALAWAVVILPLASIVWLTYLTGTWMGGGVVGGLLSVLVTAGFFLGAWALRRRRRAR
jgi:hypothetical protein